MILEALSWVLIGVNGIWALINFYNANQNAKQAERNAQSLLAVSRYLRLMKIPMVALSNMTSEQVREIIRRDAPKPEHMKNRFDLN